MLYLPSIFHLQIPITTFLLTHAYFCFYHTLSNITIRRLRFAIRNVNSKAGRIIIQAVWIFLFSYFTAFMETFTIANVTGTFSTYSTLLINLLAFHDHSILPYSFLIIHLWTRTRCTVLDLCFMPSIFLLASPCT